MKVKNIIEEDFVNSKYISMLIATTQCAGKCVDCQNEHLKNSPTFEIPDEILIQRYLNNPVTEAICFGGLEPFDTFKEIENFIYKFRQISNDLIIIYSGYYPIEIIDQLQELSQYNNIIVKFGRYIPNDKVRHDEILGITLASSNQFARYISKNEISHDDILGVSLK